MATAEKAALPPDPLLRSTEDDAATIQASDNEKTTDKKEVAIALGAPESPKGAKGKKEDEGKEKGGYRSYLVCFLPDNVSGPLLTTLAETLVIRTAIRYLPSSMRLHSSMCCRVCLTTNDTRVWRPCQCL